MWHLTSYITAPAKYRCLDPQPPTPPLLHPQPTPPPWPPTPTTPWLPLPNRPLPYTPHHLCHGTCFWHLDIFLHLDTWHLFWLKPPQPVTGLLRFWNVCLDKGSECRMVCQRFWDIKCDRKSTKYYFFSVVSLWNQLSDYCLLCLDRAHLVSGNAEGT